MLRRKLMLLLSSLVIIFAGLAVLTTWLLQGVLGDLDHLTVDAAEITKSVGELSSSVTAAEVELYTLQMGGSRHLDRLIESVERTEQALETLSAHYVVAWPDGEAADVYRRISQHYPTFKQQLGMLATSRDAELAAFHYQRVLAISILLRSDLLELAETTQSHVRSEQLAVTRKFRWIVFGVTLSSLLVINVSVMLLLRMTGLVLRPVEKLVAASRELGMERFDHRVELDQRDEFDELARAYNHLAEQLQDNELRKIEMLHQVARTLNHELNNAAAIIELQLQLADRRSGQDDTLHKHLHQIRESLRRMTGTVESLKHIRRVVLTDYVTGEKMLDLEKSIESQPAEGGTS
ncbi:MAG: HAMP domain-containing protein [Planctomycetes bacterium]|nr:HAMP domain-containing protein [Planctomycetota bacterium]NOG53751.1 HAMP domain-containing protein [Planctomycetota bacterium]